MQFSSSTYDVIILGGALAGSASALLLKRRYPDLRVLVIEKSDTFGPRVGESTVEISAYFLARVLGQTKHLNHRHLPKQGLRFWFASNEAETLDQVGELGPRSNVKFPGFQLDRSVFDAHLLKEAAGLGVEVLRPAKVRDVELEEGGTQTVTFQDGREPVSARWVIDASGVAALLARKRGWLVKNEEHPCSSIWARFTGVGDFDSLDLETRFPQWRKRTVGLRHNATNHLLGDGYWIWMIPLHNGSLSAGVVYDERRVQIPPGPSLGERLLAFIRSHPAGAELFRQATFVEGDVHARSHFAYHSKQICGDGYFLVGDAGAFIDPFYSPGMDWLAFSTVQAVEQIVRERTGQAWDASALPKLNSLFQTSYERWFEAIYRDKYAYLGDIELMNQAFRFDLAMYYRFVVATVFSQGWQGFLWPPFSHPLAPGPFALMRWHNRQLVRIAERRKEQGRFGARNTGTYVPFTSYSLGSDLSGRLLYRIFALFGLMVRDGLQSLRGKQGEEPTPAKAPVRAA